MLHYYFCEALLPKLNKHDIDFHCGESMRVLELLDYSQIIYQADDELYKEDGYPGLFEYELMEPFADAFIELVDDNEWPCEDEFKQAVTTIIKNWMAA